MENPRIVSREEWLQERRELLRDEKALTRYKDFVAEKRRQLPWVKIDKNYTFENEAGDTETLNDLFEGRRQLIIYHFMYPDHWDNGCPGCTEVADNFSNIIEYINNRDATMLAVSRCSIPKIVDYKARHGWRFKWVSSIGSDFNYDFNISFRDPKEKKMFNFRNTSAEVEETHGVSVFILDEEEVYHTYTCHARGVDILFCSLQYMDLLPLGRQDELYFNAGGEAFRRLP